MAGVWARLLKLENVGRRDNFFELGGHSLLIVQMLESLRRDGLHLQARDVYSSADLTQLAQAVTREAGQESTPPGGAIPANATRITPEMVTLVALDQESIDRIVRSIPGGVANVQDIYPLAPLQEGILFQYLMNEQRADTYVASTLLQVESRARLDGLINALQRVVERHDILRTAILWQGLPRPLQVVQRQATLPVVTRSLDVIGDLTEQLREWGSASLDLRQAPLIELVIAPVPERDGWFALLKIHHIIDDDVSLRIIISEIVAQLESPTPELPQPVAYREHVGETLRYAATRDPQAYFSDKLREVEEPTAPFGLLDIQGDSSRFEEAQEQLEPTLVARIRAHARRMGVSAATVFHTAWAMVVAATSARDDVVFGTVLSGRLQGRSGGGQAVGMFINTLPLRLQLQKATASGLVRQAQNELLGLVVHEQASLALAQRCSSIPAAAPLFTSVLNYRHGGLDLKAEWERAAGIRVLTITDRTHYPVAVSVDDDGRGIALTCLCDPRIPPQRINSYLRTAVGQLVQALEDNSPTPVAAISILPAQELHRVLHGFNETATDYPRELPIHQIFERHVERTPGAVAVLDGDRALSYSQLNARANQIARYLLSQGVRHGEYVPIHMQRSLLMLITQLAVLKAGGVYVPVDPELPVERRLFIVQDCGARRVLCDTGPARELQQPAVEWVNCADLGEVSGEMSEVNVARNTAAPAPACVMYTSGSTGMPKGVLITHRAVVRLVINCGYAQIESTDRFAYCSSPVFDSSTFEIWGALLNGASVVIVPQAVVLDSAKLAALLMEQKVTVFFLTIGLFSQYIDALAPVFPRLKYVITGGDIVDPVIARRVLDNNPPKHLINAYGPTECTTFSTTYLIESVGAQERSLPIGRPMSNARIYILNSHLQPVPVGSVGEIYIGGDGVALGYLNRPELTRERFVPDPFNPDAAMGMYKSGDLGRWRDDGNVEFLGRNDQQVKVRGFRIELGEIETQLLRHATVREAVVLAREDAPGQKRLVAYFTCKGETAPGAEELRAYLKSVLPGYMVPSAFVLLPGLPVTSSGKVDRRALPVPEQAAFATREYEAPQGEIEEILAALWQSLLRVERVGRRDNFFELGGHSLLIVHMMERLRKVGLSAEIRRVYESTSLQDLALALTRGAVLAPEVPPNRIPSGCQQITPDMLPLVELESAHLEQIAQVVPGGATNIQDVYPLAPLQEGILFHYLLNAQLGDAYILPFLLSVHSREQLDKLIVALQRVIDRHDVLRTAALWEQLPRPLQVVYRQATLPVDTLTLDPHRDAVEQMKEQMKPQRQRLDLRRAPLMRLQIAADPHGSHWYALLQFHHLVTDHESLELMFAEVIAYLQGRGRELPEPVPYRNHVAQALAYAKRHDSESFFRRTLAEVDEPTAPFGLLDVHGDGSQNEEAQQQLEPQLAKRLRTQARGLGVSAATLFHAAWGLVVAHTSGRDDVVYGTVLLGRLQGNAGTQPILGMFINTLPLRLKLKDVTPKELVEQTQRELVELLNHEQASLAVAQRCSGIGSSAPLFSALLNYRHSVVDAGLAFAGAADMSLLASHTGTNYPLLMAVDDSGEHFILTAQTDRRLDAHRIVGYMSTAIQSLLEALEADSPVPALELSILPDAERRQVVEVFNATARRYPQEKLIHELFEEQVKRTPGAMAVVFNDQSLTYAELNRKANQLARYLRKMGVGPDRLVGVCLDRSVEMIVALMGVLKAGGAYVPLDPNNPTDRLEHLLTDAAPQVLLSQARLQDRLPATGCTFFALDSGWPEIAHLPDGDLSNASPQLLPKHLAYVIYTSGSTGKPKGVMVEHRNVVNYATYAATQFDIASGEGSLVATSFSFDLMLTGLYPTLLTGRPVRLCREEQGMPALAAELLALRNVAPLKITPSHLALLEPALHEGKLEGRIRALVLGGEPLQAAALHAWRKFAPSTRIFNHYGPTETTIGCIVNELVDQSSGAVPLGRPIANMQIHILNSRLQPVPLGVVGEIYIGGDGVARGYLNRPELTQERFIGNPFSREPDARLYKTGDLGRWRPEGLIDYLGRNDDQVKVRGFRIELGEIETQLLRHPQVKHAAVLAREDVPGEKRLVAYFTCKGETPPGVEDLRSFLKDVLPSYMLPSAFVLLESLPVTPNGKLDRRALPVPEQGAFATRQYEAPQGEVEEIVAALWQTLLRVERVGRHDNFFELGGHSLLIVQMMERLRKVGLSAAIRRVYESTSLRDLAVALTRGQVLDLEVPRNRIPAGCQQITPDMLPLVELEPAHLAQIARLVPAGAANIQDIYPLAPLQEGILFHHMLSEDGGDLYLEAALLAIRSRERVDELVVALQHVIDRHDVLRTAALWEQLPQPVQVVYRRAILPVQTLTLDPHREAIGQMKEQMKSEQQRLDLRQAPLMRLQIAADPQGSHWYALLQFHHLVSDHESLELMFAEVAAHLQGRERELPEPVPYRNHVAQALAYAKGHDSESFFRSKLAEIDEPTAPFGLLDVHGGASQIDEVQQQLEPQLAKRLRTQARRLGVSAATLFHAAWGLVVAHTSGRDDVVYGTVLLGRLQGNSGTQPVLGMFINTLPLRLNLRSVAAKELVEQTQRELVELLNHEQASLAVAQRCSGIGSSAPLFSALLNYRHSTFGVDAPFCSDGEISVLAYEGRTNYPILMSVDDMGEGFTLTAESDRRAPPARLLQYLLRSLQSLAEALEQAPQTPALQLAILPDEERRQVVEVFNATRQPHPQGKLIHELFAEQARRTPAATAVVFNDQSLTYSELDRKANQLAHRLRQEGVGPNRLVGICINRSLEMVIGLLGILKAGGAYLPLDPNYPIERLQHMLEDATPQVILTQDELRSLLPRTSTRIIALESEPDSRPLNDPVLPAAVQVDMTAEDLVYVIYTSGSTGKPKATAMAHGSMVNLMEWHRRTFGRGEGKRVLQFAALSFDVAFQEAFSTLCTGGTLVLLEEWLRREATALTQYIHDNAINRLFVPPLMLQSLAEYYQAGTVVPETLEDIITAGEQLRVSPEIVRLFERLPGTKLHNHYGPTESHVVTALTLTGDPQAWPTLPSIGRAIDNTQIYILDGQQRPVPVGVAGEIFIGGIQVARGYWGRPELTEQRFIRDPFSTSTAARLYRTGDLGRWCSDGTIEHLGRNDLQVKIRGYRIELGEIEAQLGRHQQVKDVAVIARDEQGGAKRLVAYVVPRVEGRLDVERLRADLLAALPDYMVPAAFVELPRLPVTPNGKLDRRALPAPTQEGMAGGEYAAPQGEFEEVLATLWQQLLRVDRVGRGDNFFELGGHSLHLMRLNVRIKEHFNVHLPVAVSFTCPTVRDMAQFIQSHLPSEEARQRSVVMEHEQEEGVI